MIQCTTHKSTSDNFPITTGGKAPRQKMSSVSHTEEVDPYKQHSNY